MAAEMTAEELKFLTELTSEKIADDARNAETRAAVLESVLESVDPLRIVLKEALTFSVDTQQGRLATQRNSQSGGSSLKNKVKASRLDDEYDTVHDRLTKAIPDKLLKRAQWAMNELISLSHSLCEAGYSDKEVRDLFWKPLSREGICPDNFVPDRFNETVQVFRGSSDAYQARLEADGQAVDEMLLGNIGTAIDVGGSVAGALGVAAGAPTEMLTAVSMATSFAKLNLSILQATDSGSIDSVTEAIGSTLSECLGATPLPPMAVGAFTTFVVKTVKTGDAFAELLKETDTAKKAEKNARQAVKELAGALEQGFAKVDPLGKRGLMAIAGAWLARKLSAFVKTKELAAAAQKKDVNACGQIIGGGLEVWFQFALQQSGGDADLTAALRNYAHNPEAFSDAVREAQKQAEQECGEEITKLLSGDTFQDDLDAALDTADVDPAVRQRILAVDKQQNSIEKKLRELEALQATVKMAESMFDAGMGLGTSHFSPLYLATGGKSLLKNMAMAAKRTNDLRQWYDAALKADRAASVYSAAFMNRVQNILSQISQRTVNMMFDVLEMASGAAGIAGMVGANGAVIAGNALGSAATIGRSGAQAVIAIKDNVEAMRQWKKYCDCLAMGPLSDRKLMRSVIRGNPTLSKYAMAYGAVVEKDPIALRGMKLCGLSEENIETDGSVSLVVKFLEAQLDEDPKLLLQTPTKEFVVKGLSLGSVMATFDKAHEQHRFQTRDTGALETCLTDFERAQLAYERDNARLRDARDGRAPDIKLLQRYATAKGRFEAARSALEKTTAPYEAAWAEYEQVKSRTPDPKKTAPEEAVVREYLDAQIAAAGAGDRRRKAAEEFLATVDLYGAVSRECRDAIRRQLNLMRDFRVVRDNFLSCASALVDMLDAYKPVKLGEKKEELTDEDVREYLRGLSLQAAQLKRDVDIEHRGLDRQIAYYDSELRAVSGDVSTQVPPLRGLLGKLVDDELPQLARAITQWSALLPLDD